MKPTLFSRYSSRPALRNYVLSLVRNPNPKGVFYKKTRYLKFVPDSVVLRLLINLNYDGIIFEKGGKISGSVFFQRHGNALHLFSIETQQELRGQGVAKEAARYFIRHAKTVPGIKRVRIGGGKDEIVSHIFEGLRADEKQLGIKVLKAGWVELL